MADTNRPGNIPDDRGPRGADASRDDSLEGRGRALDAKLASRRAKTQAEADDAKSRYGAGYGQAMKLSSEFIAGIVVGAGLGWGLDYVAGTSPWGLIILLLLGFCAGVLNVLRSAGVVADAGIPGPDLPSDPDR